MGEIHCSRTCAGHHAARVGEIMEVTLVPGRFSQTRAVLLGDQREIVDLPRTGCRLEVVATAPTRDREIDLLLPGEVLTYSRMPLLGDRLELPSERSVRLAKFHGFKLQLAMPPMPPPPSEDAVVRGARPGRWVRA